MSEAPETIDVNIMVLVGSNGKATACKAGDRGWGDLMDDLMDWPPRGQKGEPQDPEATTRAMVTVTLPMPSIAKIAGTVVSTEIVPTEAS